jgi:hypothetical protein
MPADGFVPGNRLLAALPADILELLTPELETVPLRNRDVVQRIVGKRSTSTFRTPE